MGETVVVTSPDVNGGVLAPTLSDAITAAQSYSSTAASSAAAATAAKETTLLAMAAAQASASAAAASAAAAQAAGPTILSGATNIVPRAKFKRALAAAGDLQTVNDYVIQTYTTLSDQAIEWTEGAYVVTYGVVWMMTQTALGGPSVFTDAMMGALMASAFALPA